MFGRLFPRHLQIIQEINARFLREVANRYPGDNDKLRNMSIFEEGPDPHIRMAYLAIVGSHSVNGVSALHTELLKKNVVPDFFDLYPEKFNNKTNGITQRRWLKKCNPELSELITSRIGDKWITNLFELKKLEKFAKDKKFQTEWREVKNIQAAVVECTACDRPLPPHQEQSRCSFCTAHGVFWRQGGTRLLRGEAHYQVHQFDCRCGQS
jgi:starch phosphorylase